MKSFNNKVAVITAQGRHWRCTFKGPCLNCHLALVDYNPDMLEKLYDPDRY